MGSDASADWPDDLYEVFDPWTGASDDAVHAGAPHPPASGAGDPPSPAREPWRPPAKPRPRRVPRPARADVRVDENGTVEPGVVLAAALDAALPTPRRVGPRIPAPTQATPLPDPAEAPGPYLRRVAIPAIEVLTSRLTADGHHTTVQDMLDLQDPTMRLLLWPRPGPLELLDARILSTLEINADQGTGLVRSLFWVGSRSGQVSELAELPAGDLEVEWIRLQVLEFVRRILERV